MTITVQMREHAGKGFNRRLRSQGITPGIIYGKGEPIPVQMRTDHSQRFIQAEGETKRTIELNLEDEKGKTSVKRVILKESQFSNWGNKLLHVDFLEVSDDTVLTFNVPVKTTDECLAVKLGGVVQLIRRTIPVRCAVKDMPEFILANIEQLGFGESVHVLDLKYPKGVKPIVKGRNFTVVTTTGRIKEEVASDLVEEGQEAEALAEESK